MNKINLEALHYYLSYRHVPSPLSIFEGVYKPPPIDLSSLRFSPVHTLSEEETVDKMDEILRRAIRKRLTDKVGFFTSGGIDSGIVTAIASEISDKPIKTFSLTYYEESETEGKRTDREYARWLSEIYKTEHHEEIISFDDFPRELPKIIRCIGEPFSGYVSVYLICRFAKQYVDAALTGDWPDELFGSYKAHRLAYQYPAEEPWRLRYSTLVFNDEEKRELYSKEVRQKTDKYSTLEHLKKYFHDLTAEDSLNRMLESEFRSFFPDHTFMSIDRLSRARSLEIRAPYSAPEFVDFAVKIPGQLKMKNGETKYILKQLALRYLPQGIVFRQKEGFVTPTLPLVRRLKDYVKSTLSPANLKKHSFFNIEYVQWLVDDFYGNGDEQQAYKLWNLVCFQVWYEIYVEGNK